MTRPTRDELIDAVQALLLRMPMNPGALHGKAADIVDGGIDLGGGVRLAIVEEFGSTEQGGWCPVHGSAFCPEQYMLANDGSVMHGYRHVWDEAIRCDQRQPLFRIVTPDPGGAVDCDSCGINFVMVNTGEPPGWGLMCSSCKVVRTPDPGEPWRRKTRA